MPRAFLITRRRYNGTEDFAMGRDYSPERVVLPGYGGGQPSSDGASDCASETSSECPDELYNLTKLAEVSLAAAAGTLVHPRASTTTTPGASSSELSLRERTRLFFERIESEREILETVPSTRKSPPSYPRNSISSFGSSSEGSKSDDSEEHECPDCGKKYSTSSNLARHRQTHRSLGDKKARRCPHCDKIYVSMPAYSMHVRTHNQECKCHYCGKCFSRPWLLQGHIRTHTGEKPFKCTICDKAFADKSNLRAHVQTHSNTKPHVCSRCGKAFALKSYLYKHEESSCTRSHNRGHVDKAETPRTRITETPTSSPTSSPTSVIVQCPRSSLAAQGHRNLGNPDHVEAKRPRTEDATVSANDLAATLTDVKEVAEVGKRGGIFSRIVVRTSVISPNPEHLRHAAGARTNGGPHLAIG